MEIPKDEDRDLGGGAVWSPLSRSRCSGQPSLTQEKMRRLELTAGAPRGQGKRSV